MPGAPVAHRVSLTHHPSLVTRHGFFVTGTDTGVGKTVVACALLAAFAARGVRAAGHETRRRRRRAGRRDLKHEDVEQLLAAANVAAPRDLVNPYCFEPPIAPHIAAARAGTSRSISTAS